MENAKVSLWTEQSSDAELIAGVRSGESAAFGVLFERHGSAARRVAGMYSAVASDVDDIVSEAFARVLKALQQGDGPDMAFRAYLFTVVRRTGLDMIAKGKRTRPDEDMTTHDRAVGYEKPSDEPALDNFEQSVVASAFKSLPERWQVVLWYTEIEKKSPGEVAPILGLSPNGVAALAYRAREALRQAYLQQHLATTDNVECLSVSENLAAYVRGGLTKREHAKVEAHVKACDRCTALVGELEDVNRGLRAVIAPLILGLLGVGALESSLPIGGIGAAQLGTSAGVASGAASGAAGSAAGGLVGGVAAGAGAGTAVGLSGLVARVVAGAHGGTTSAPAVSGFLANTFGSGSGLLTGVAATVGVAALAVASAGIVGTLSIHDESDLLSNPVGTVSFTVEAAPQPGTSDLPVYIPDQTISATVPSDPVATPTSNGPGTAASNNTGTGDDTGTGGTGGTDPLDVTLALSAGALNYIELAATSPVIPVRVRNAGTDDATAVTVTITPPVGVTFSGPGAGGSGYGRAGENRLGDWLAFASGTIVLGDWTCDVSASLATCTIPTIAAGSVAWLTLDVAVTGTLAANAVTTITIADVNGVLDTASIRTGLAPVERDGSLLFAAEGNLGTSTAGGMILSCDQGNPNCVDALNGNGSSNNNSWAMEEVNGEGGTHNSASATMAVPADATILVAYLVWSANHGPSENFSGLTTSASIRPPGQTEYVPVTADEVTTWTDPGGRVYYQARTDVTDLVQQYGGGSWTLADIAVTDRYTDGDPSYFAGFALTAVYEQASLPESSVAIYGGVDPVTKDDDADYVFATDVQSKVDISLIAWEGDKGLAGDTLTLDGDAMTPQRTTSDGEPVAGDANNAFDSTAVGSGVANSLGTDAKAFETETVEAGEHTLSASTDGDNFAIGMVVVQTTPTDPGDDEGDDD